MIKNSKLRFIFFIILLLLFRPSVMADGQYSVLTIDSCYAMSERNYPMIRQYALLEKSEKYSVSNAAKGYLPQCFIVGQASYQSDVTKLPVSLPGFSFEELSKDQYRIYTEVVQPITDLLHVKNNVELVRANVRVELQKTKVELHKLRQRVNQIFFGILLIDAQAAQIQLVKKDLRIGIDKLHTAIKNGVALEIDAAMLEVELLKLNQRMIELKALRQAYIDMLSSFINRSIDEATVLEKPHLPVLRSELRRAELDLFASQKTVFDIRSKLLVSKNTPRLSLFFQAGFGRPSLNLLNNDFSSYYLGGVRLNWSLSSLYTYAKEKKSLDIAKDLLDVHKDVFLFNTNLSLMQKKSQIIKLEGLIASDRDIMLLRERIKEVSKSRLELGTVTANDYISTVYAEDQAKQNLSLHQIQLLMAQYDYNTTAGN